MNRPGLTSIAQKILVVAGKIAGKLVERHSTLHGFQTDVYLPPVGYDPDSGYGKEGNSVPYAEKPNFTVCFLFSNIYLQRFESDVNVDTYNAGHVLAYSTATDVYPRMTRLTVHFSTKKLFNFRVDGVEGILGIDDLLVRTYQLIPLEV